ncbi:hypothetical protein V6N13_039272 [Hibiscus sabdariffa]
MALTAAAVHSYVFMTRISRPMVSRGNACFASTNTSSVQSTQPPSIAATHHLNHTARPLENFSPDIWGDRFAALPFTNSVTLASLMLLFIYWEDLVLGCKVLFAELVLLAEPSEEDFNKVEGGVFLKVEFELVGRELRNSVLRF